ncbi:MAG TPA: ImmA/IrrE family metallo-endopeptidase [Solirubrobacterales bacterium]|nr:ImmA/IrrE family metallo-endopeptidase [Solirubrobacterales bacterium]
MPAYIWDGESLPVPVEDIVDSIYGLRVRLVEDLSSAPGAPDTDGTLSGLLLTGPGEIWVNKEEADRWPGRRRFTICHELGHWELHRTGPKSLFCRTAQVDDPETLLELDDETRPPIPVTEEEANAFAAAMLMPAYLVRAEHANLGDDTAELCARFNCSSKAMNHRLRSVIESGS